MSQDVEGQKFKAQVYSLTGCLALPDCTVLSAGAVLAAAAICATPLIKGRNGGPREMLIRAGHHTQQEPAAGVRHTTTAAVGDFWGALTPMTRC